MSTTKMNQTMYPRHFAELSKQPACMAEGGGTVAGARPDDARWVHVCSKKRGHTGDHESRWWYADSKHSEKFAWPQS